MGGTVTKTHFLFAWLKQALEYHRKDHFILKKKKSSKRRNSYVCMVFVFTVLWIASERSVLASKNNKYKRQTLDQARTGSFNGSMGTTSPG